MVIAWDFGGLEECVRRYFGLSIVALCLFSEVQHLDTATADFDQSGPEEFYVELLHSDCGLTLISPLRRAILFFWTFFVVRASTIPEGRSTSTFPSVCVCARVRLSVFWGMPLDVVIAPVEDCFWPDLQDTDMRLKIRVRRMKEGREFRGVYPPGLRAGEGMCVCVCFCVCVLKLRRVSNMLRM